MVKEGAGSCLANEGDYGWISELLPSRPEVKLLYSSFFDRDTLVVAEDLLGKYLVRDLPSGGRMLGRVVETEGYTGDDPAFHAWGLVDPPTGLVKPVGRGYDLFAKPGTAYVYLCYGVHWLLNVVTEREGVAGCVLIRAVEPVAGVVAMKTKRSRVKRDVDLTNGPGKLTQAFGIGREEHGTDLTQPPLYFVEAESNLEIGIATSSRIGISRAIDRQWRYFIAGNPYVSPGIPSDLAAKKRRKRQPRG